jgi:hypothetical protein
MIPIPMETEPVTIDVVLGSICELARARLMIPTRDIAMFVQIFIAVDRLLYREYACVCIQLNDLA